eukprot:8668370-Lingulodinium_polyedra.AAC.1
MELWRGAGRGPNDRWRNDLEAYRDWLLDEANKLAGQAFGLHRTVATNGHIGAVAVGGHRSVQTKCLSC